MTDEKLNDHHVWLIRHPSGEMPAKTVGKFHRRPDGSRSRLTCD